MLNILDWQPREQMPSLQIYTVTLLHQHTVFTANGGERLYLDCMPALETFNLMREEGLSTVPAPDVAVDRDAVLRCFARFRSRMDPIRRMVLRGIKSRLSSADVEVYVD